MITHRTAALAGIAGPVAFVGAWVTGGLLRDDGYSPARDAISRLAEQGAPTLPLMTAGFVGFGLAMPFYARELGRALGSRGTQVAVTVTAVGTLAVAALPLSADGGQPIDTWHTVAAGTAYVANVVAPIVVARHLRSPAARRASYVLSATMAACLLASVTYEDLTGLFQRTGLTLFDVWSVTGALVLLVRGSGRR